MEHAVRDKVYSIGHFSLFEFMPSAAPCIV
jgi:hypothetical protein